MPTLLNPETTRTKNQPDQRPKLRCTISCIKYRETTPSSTPVHENQISRITSNQSGASAENLFRYCKSVRIYGALGKKINHKKAKTGMTM